ncbi:ventricular zone-expressed PH domain-containing protein homolog 1-like [Lingula anatina]|uniref:Ventricular zone-expressed PH domain-containing protein homolog 1-like n=1 Tax=Lingula anatina TaxID=7574 RepID=A0A1S3II50_LINAN|nr:ventricular zone-expressed PH domain-containing protein homolog 1-like [Lingula anatina]|eukprot:XP_013397892.1 ventricular zone-expressed PH domain-containing protein homolog 1-like [Lingula anatina]
MERVALRIPLPSKITLEGHRHKKRPKVHFLCEKKGDQCLYCQHSFNIKTKQAKTWIHLMFLDRQAKAPSALSPRDPSVAELREIWETMMHTADSGRSFVTVVTSSFPTTKDQDSLRQELDSVRFFDVFEFNGSQRCWACFLCNHPEKATGLLQDGHPIIAGHLKEKKGRWKFFKRWKTRYFTLSGSTMTYSVSKGGVTQETYLPINKIQSVKAIKKGSRDIPRAFEIFANDQKFILKPKERKCAEQWVQCIHIAVARSHKSPSSGPPIPEQFLLEQETKVSRL